MIPRLLVVVTLLILTLLAGCLGPDDMDGAEGDGAQQAQQEGYGSLTGTIITVNLDPVDGARVSLVADAELVAETTTSPSGEYTLRNIPPGEYRIQVTAPCCREAAQGVTVVADEVTSISLQLEVFTADDLRLPYRERFDWVGFLACTARWYNPPGPHHDHNVLGIPGGVSGANVCAIAGDPTGDDDFLRVFEAREGLKSVVGTMSWTAPGAAMGDELTLIFEVSRRPNAQPRYANPTGTSPLEFRADAGDVIEDHDEGLHHFDFENIEGSMNLMYRIFAGGMFNVVYQQQFTVYWDMYYWEHAPDDATALPDQ